MAFSLVIVNFFLWLFTNLGFDDFFDFGFTKPREPGAFVTAFCFFDADVEVVRVRVTVVVALAFFLRPDAALEDEVFDTRVLFQFLEYFFTVNPIGGIVSEIAGEA